MSLDGRGARCSRESRSDRHRLARAGSMVREAIAPLGSKKIRNHEMMQICAGQSSYLIGEGELWRGKG